MDRIFTGPNLNTVIACSVCNETFVETTTPVPTTTFAPTTATPSPTTTNEPVSCFGEATPCGGNGACIAHDTCKCNPNSLGVKCQINMQTSSDTYVAFGTNSNTNAVSVASSLPDASGAVNYQFETNHLQLSTVFGTSETARRGV
jgi:hypothetical protein